MDERTSPQDPQPGTDDEAFARLRAADPAAGAYRAARRPFH